MITEFSTQVDQYIGRLNPAPLEPSGRLLRVVGMTVEVSGVAAPVGAKCRISTAPNNGFIEAEVVGFNDDVLFLMPYGSIEGVAPGASVTVVSRFPMVNVSRDMLGRVVNAQAEPIDGLGQIKSSESCGLFGFPINPMERGPVEHALDTGIKAINCCLTLGQGQRIGLVAGSGVGKSVLLAMLARNTAADVVVIGLVGERGREVQEFVSTTLGEAGLRKSIVVASPTYDPPVARLKAAHLAHVIAEYFRDRGKRVLLLFDSLTRVAHAQREIGLAVGEPPTAKGYPPSVFALLPSLIERAGVGAHGHGSITAIYTLLAEGDDRADPIVDIARASLDGQVMLSRDLADAAHYPSIDLNGSISRIMDNLVDKEQVNLANRLRRYWSLYRQNIDLIQVGAYEAGTNTELDEAIELIGNITEFLRQESEDNFSFEDCWKGLKACVGGTER